MSSSQSPDVFQSAIRNPQSAISGGCGRRKGQAVLEYCILVVILVAALMAAKRFFKAVIMGRWQQTADSFGFGRQYEPGRTTIAQ